MKNCCRLYCLSLACLSLFGSWTQALTAQTLYQGNIYDADNREPLVFVSIQLLGSATGTYTDLDGRFSLTANPGDTLRIRYLGYAERRLILEDAVTALEIALARSGVGLEEVVVRPQENPAWRIIRAVIDQRDRHDPQQMAGYTYEAYHKSLLNIDTLLVAPDSRRGQRRRPARNEDRAADRQRNDELKTRRQELFLREMHLWVTESRSRHAYRAPNQHKEVVLATQSSLPNDVTGGVNPINFQPFGFYREVIRLEFTNQNYVNPISRGTFQHYNFHLADTIVNARDTTYLIEFEPLAGKFFTALRGVLYVNTDGYALERVIATSADSTQTMQIRLQQESAQVDGTWFPQGLQADVFFETGMSDFSIQYAFRNRSILTEVELSLPPVGFFDHYLKENKSAGRPLTDSLRLLPLSDRERNTYVYWDSLPELRVPNRILSAYGPIVQAVSSGSLPGKRIDLVLSDLLTVNAREGTRLGLGLKTSPKLWSGGTLYAYGGYGLDDRQWKYGGALELQLYPKRDLRLRLGYRRDLAAPGGISYLSSVNNPWSSWDARSLILERFDALEERRGDLIYRPHGSWQVNLFAQTENRTLLYPYAFGESPIRENVRYEVRQVGTRVRWAPRERLVKIGQLETILYPVFPVLDLTVTHLQSGSFQAQRVAARIDHEKRWKYLGISEINLQAGWLSASLPYPYLFQAPGNGGNSVSGGNLFNTAGPTEFAQETFAYVFFTHNFGTLLGRVQSTRFRPELRLMQQFGWGRSADAVSHGGIDFRDMRHGFLESGVGLDNVLRISYFKTLYFGLGASVWYRWGAYHLPELRDNVAVQLTLNMSV